MQYKKFKFLSKKSAIDTLLEILIVVIFLIFLYLFIAIQSNSEKEDINYQLLKKDSTQLLINYLGTRLNFNNEELKMSSAILNYFEFQDEALFQKIAEKTADFFSGSHLQTDYSSWELELSSGGKRKVIESEQTKSFQQSKKLASRIVIPLNDRKSFVEAKLFFVQTKFKEK